MQLGAFSISLAVKDIKASMAFYEKLGFRQFGNAPVTNWAILKSGDVIIGLFQGMFEKNMLTFNPGWNQDAKEVNPFTDVRAIQKHLEGAGLELGARADAATSGPAYVTLTDPDGNPILIDQHR